MSSHSLNTRTQKFTETTRDHVSFRGPLETGPPKTKKSVARTRTRTRVRPSSALRSARKPRAPLFFRAFSSIRVQTRLRDALFCARFLPSRSPTSHPPVDTQTAKATQKTKEKRAQKNRAYMLRGQRERERKEKKTERAKGNRDANHARLAIVEVVCRFFPSRRARRLPMSRERFFGLLERKKERKKERKRREVIHFETLNDNSLGGGEISFTETPSSLPSHHRLASSWARDSRKWKRL